MGCTILLLALINLEERGEDKNNRRHKQLLNHPAFMHKRDSSRACTKTNSFAWLNGNISCKVLERGAHNKTETNKRTIVCWLENPVRDTFNVPYDLFPPLLIKLLIMFGCYGHQGDIPQVLSAARAQKLGHIPFSLSLFFSLSASWTQHNFIPRSPKQWYPLSQL